VHLINENGEVVAECALTSEHVVRPYANAVDRNEMARPMAGSSGSYSHFPTSFMLEVANLTQLQTHIFVIPTLLWQSHLSNVSVHVSLLI
jgi:hypothetical protein